MYSVSTTDLTSILNVSPQRISALIKQLNIPEDEINRSGRAKQFSPSAMRKILEHRGLGFDTREIMAFCNNKGGEGKTSIAVNTALRLSSLGYKVVLVDADPQGNASSYLLRDFDYEKVLFDVVKGEATVEECLVQLTENFSILPSGLVNENLSIELSQMRVNHRTYFSELLEGVDANYIVWDLSPSLSMLNYFALLSCDRINIVSTLTEFGVQGVEMTNNLIQQAQSNYPDYGPVVEVLINKFDMRQTSSMRHMSDIQDLIGLKLADNVIRVDSSIARAQADSTTLKSGSNAYKDICSFVDSITNMKNVLSNAQQ